MPVFTDQIGRSIELKSLPGRIISLVPSQTELLYDLGLDKQVAGITKFCVHPHEWFRSKTRIGGTKTLNLEKIRSLKPDLILANKEENVKEQVEELALEFPVWTSDINNLDDALHMIRAVGSITGKEEAASGIGIQVENQFRDLSSLILPRIRAAYLIWRDPYMTVGGDTFIHDLLAHAGFENIFSNHTRYPMIEIESLRDADTILLSSEPYPFHERHIQEISALLPSKKILLVDGEMFSWYGSRLLYAANYLRDLRKQIETNP